MEYASKYLKTVIENNDCALYTPEELNVLFQLFSVYIRDTGICAVNTGYGYVESVETSLIKSYRFNNYYHFIPDIRDDYTEYVDYFAWMVEILKDVNEDSRRKVIAGAIYLINWFIRYQVTLVNTHQLLIYKPSIQCELEWYFETWLKDISCLDGTWIEDPKFNYLCPYSLIKTYVGGDIGIFMGPGPTMFNPFTRKFYDNLPSYMDSYLEHIYCPPNLDQRHFMIILEDLPETPTVFREHSNLPLIKSYLEEPRIVNPTLEAVGLKLKLIFDFFKVQTQLVYGDKFILAFVNTEFTRLSSNTLDVPEYLDEIKLEKFLKSYDRAIICVGELTNFAKFLMTFSFGYEEQCDSISFLAGRLKYIDYSYDPNKREFTYYNQDGSLDPYWGLSEYLVNKYKSWLKNPVECFIDIVDLPKDPEDATSTKTELFP